MWYRSVPHFAESEAETAHLGLYLHCHRKRRSEPGAYSFLKIDQENMGLVDVKMHSHVRAVIGTMDRELM